MIYIQILLGISLNNTVFIWTRATSIINKFQNVYYLRCVFIYAKSNLWYYQQNHWKMI
jgi:hypothetical protein